MNFTNKVIFFWILLNFPNLIDTKKHGKHGKHSTITTSTNTLTTSTNTLTTTNNNTLTTNTNSNTLTTTNNNTLTTTNNNTLTTSTNTLITSTNTLTTTGTLTTTNNNTLTTNTNSNTLTTLINIERIGKSDSSKSDSSKSDSIKKNQIDNRKKQKLNPAWHVVYIVIILGLVGSIYYYTKKPKEIIINDVAIEYDMATNTNIQTYEQPVTENPLYRQLDLGNYEEIDPEYQVV